MVRIGEVENGLLKCFDLVIHLVSFDMRLELREVVDGALAVGGSDHVGGVLPDVGGNFAPSGLDSGDGVGESTILHGRRVSMSAEHEGHASRVLTMSKRTASVVNVAIGWVFMLSRVVVMVVSLRVFAKMGCEES